MTAPQLILPRDAGRFVGGGRYSPTTQFQLGERRGVRTEFKPGQAAHNRLPVGAETVRIFRGVARVWVKVAEPSRWRERAKLNDQPDNLIALTRAEHAREHADEIQAARFGARP